MRQQRISFAFGNAPFGSEGRITKDSVRIAGLQAADRAYEKGQYDVSELAKYLAGLLKGQLSEA